jgi:hypothetical protein
MSKYGNKKTVYNGMVFDSKAECERYKELVLLEKAGKIKDLKRQVKFELIPKFGRVRQFEREQTNERAVYYTADFTYTQIPQMGMPFQVAEDVKSEATAKNKEYVIKRKLFKQKYKNWVFREEIR